MKNHWSFSDKKNCMLRVINQKRAWLAGILLAGFVMPSKAQQQPMYSQYMFNMLNINPAYAGSRGVPSVTALYRNQWVGIPGAPATSSISFDMPIDAKKIGVGVQLFDDRLGIERTTGLNLAYAFRIQLSESGTLSLGLQAGLLNYRANYLDVTTFQANDPSFNQNVSALLPSAAAGVYYNSDKFYIGFSTPALLKTKVGYDNATDIQSVSGRDLHLFLTSGCAITLNPELVLKPSFLVKAVSGAPVQFDVNSNLWIQNKIAFGCSYRTGDAVVFLAELQLNNQLRFGYAYDSYTNKNISLGSLSTVTHEMMLRMEFGNTNGKVSSPRYF